MFGNYRFWEAIGAEVFSFEFIKCVWNGANWLIAACTTHYFGFIRSFGGGCLLFLKEVILRNKKPVVPTQHFSPRYLRINLLRVVMLKSFVQFTPFTKKKFKNFCFKGICRLRYFDDDALAVVKYWVLLDVASKVGNFDATTTCWQIDSSSNS